MPWFLLLELDVPCVWHAVARKASLLYACAPLGLHHHYEDRIGMRTIRGAEPVQHPDGIVVPLVLILDRDDLARRHSIVAQEVL